MSTERTSAISKVIQFTTVIYRFTFGMGLALVFCWYGLFPMIATIAGLASFIDTWPTISLGLLIIVGFVTFGWIAASNRVGALVSFAGSVVSIYGMTRIYGTTNFAVAFPGFNAFEWSTLDAIAVGGFVALANFILMAASPENVYKKRGAYMAKLRQKSGQHKAALLIGIFMVSGLGTVALLSQQDTLYTNTVAITPKDYQVRFAFWGDWNYMAYNTTVKAEFDKYHAIIVGAPILDIRTAAGQAWFVNNTLAWKNKYPNVELDATIPGYVRIHNTGDDMVDLESGAVWDGSAVETIRYAKIFVQLALNNSLTNFGGINTDQEDPQADLPSYGISNDPNATRHQEATRMYDAFFSWMKVNATGMRTSTTMTMAPFSDAFDGDNDMQVLHMCNVLEGNTSGWDEIAPMIYRCGCAGTPPYGDVPVTLPKNAQKGHVEFYRQMSNLARGIQARYGNLSKLGVYMGITNCTCYGRDVMQFYKNGTLEGYGFDSFVKDVLIAKSFGPKIITIFLLNTYPDASGRVSGGVIDTWGKDFLKNLNVSVNSANATRPFTIDYQVNLNVVSDFNTDSLLNLGKPLQFSMFAVVMGINLLAALLLHPSIKRRIGRNKDTSQTENKEIVSKT